MFAQRDEPISYRQYRRPPLQRTQGRGTQSCVSGEETKTEGGATRHTSRRQARRATGDGLRLSQASRCLPYSVFERTFNPINGFGQLYPACRAVSSHHPLCLLHPLLVLFLDLSYARIDGGFGIALSLSGFFLQCLYLGFGLILDLLRPLPGLLQLCL